MRTVILYHPKDEFAGMAEDYARDFHRKYAAKPEIKLVSLDEVEGTQMAELYDVVRFPALLAVGPDSQLQKMWQDQPWPLLDEVAAYSATAA
jgi:hypothetical protein